jgi:hypothetical protein
MDLIFGSNVLNLDFLYASSVSSVSLWLNFASSCPTTESQSSQRSHRELKLGHYLFGQSLTFSLICHLGHHGLYVRGASISTYELALLPGALRA